MQRVSGGLPPGTRRGTGGAQSRGAEGEGRAHPGETAGGAGFGAERRRGRCLSPTGMGSEARGFLVGRRHACEAEPAGPDAPSRTSKAGRGRAGRSKRCSSAHEEPRAPRRGRPHPRSALVEGTELELARKLVADPPDDPRARSTRVRRPQPRGALSALRGSLIPGAKALRTRSERPKSLGFLGLRARAWPRSNKLPSQLGRGPNWPGSLLLVPRTPRAPGARGSVARSREGRCPHFADR